MIRLCVPGTLEYRDIALRVVGAASKLIHAGAVSRKEAEEFDAAIVSAFGEAFNNIALHGYAGGAQGDVEIEITTGDDELLIRIMDTGRSFDPLTVPPPEELPERGMGIFIIRSFMDVVTYRAGTPNVLELSKRWTGALASGELPTDPKRGPRSGWRMKRLPGPDAVPSRTSDREAPRDEALPGAAAGRYAKHRRR